MPAPSTRTALEFSNVTSAPRMRWTVWPLIDRPWASLSLGVLTLAIGYAVYATSGKWYWTAAASLAIIVAAWRLFLPVTFEVTLRGLKQESMIQSARTPWSEIRAVRKCSGGLLLLSGNDDSPLDALRGLFLPWGPHRTELLQLTSLYLTGIDYES